MRPLLLLPLLAALIHAQAVSPTGPTSTTISTATPTCQCPFVKCDASDSVALCTCLNNRETACKAQCPTYTPTYRPCPTSAPPPSTALTPTPITFTPNPAATPTPSCTCEPRMCIDMWPASCYCANNNKMACYKECGGVEPELQSCPPQFQAFGGAQPTGTTSTTLRSRRTRTRTASSPTHTHAPCGGGRAQFDSNSSSPTSHIYLNCVGDDICVKDPYKPGCGPECDGLGICVSKQTCGGFAGLPCPERGMVCVDDVRDDCDAESGGADCGGLCVWPH